MEIFNDISLRIPPLTKMDTLEMIQEIKGFKALMGTRERAKADIEAIVDVLLKLSKFATDLESVVSKVDINPLIVLEEGKGVKALDALVILKEKD